MAWKVRCTSWLRPTRVYTCRWGMICLPQLWLKRRKLKVTNALSNQIFFSFSFKLMFDIDNKQSINLLTYTFKENSNERWNHRKHRTYHRNYARNDLPSCLLSIVLSCLFKEDSRSWDQFPNLLAIRLSPVNSSQLWNVEQVICTTIILGFLRVCVVSTLYFLICHLDVKNSGTKRFRSYKMEATQSWNHHMVVSHPNHKHLQWAIT